MEDSKQRATTRLTDEQRQRIADAIKAFGAREVAKRLRLSREATLGLVVAGGGSHEGTEALAIQRLGRLAEDVDGD